MPHLKMTLRRVWAAWEAWEVEACQVWVEWVVMVVSAALVGNSNLHQLLSSQILILFSHRLLKAWRRRRWYARHGRYGRHG